MTKKRNRNQTFDKNNNNGVHKQSENIPRGLINVGNTCYLNSTLQCISRVSGLQRWISRFSSGGLFGYLKRSTTDGIIRTLRLSLSQDQLTFSTTFANFTTDLLGPQNSRSSITPEGLRSQLVKFYSQLNNYGQHDSHEALRCILDRLRFEEMRIWQRGILNEKKYDSSAPEDLKYEIRAWGQSAAVCTTVDRIFGGVLLTSIQCTVCKNSSIHFETILDLSLPIFSEPNPPESLPTPQKARYSKKKKQSKMTKKGRNSRDSDQFEENDSDTNEGVAGVGNDVEVGSSKSVYRKNMKLRMKNQKRSKKKGKRKMCNADGEVYNIDEEEKGLSEQERQKEDSAIELEAEDDVELIYLDEDENTFLPLIFDFNETDPDDVSLEPNQASEVYDMSDFKDLVPGSENVGNRSPGFPESFKDFVQEPADGEGLQRNAILKSPDSSAESERKSPSSSTSTGDIADTEDNVDTDGLSTTSLPKAEFYENNLCNEFMAKSQISEAGHESIIARPEEEREAKDLSICTILSSEKSTFGTDLERSLAKFFEVDELKGSNRITCEECTKRAKSSGDSGNISGDSRSSNSKDGSVLCDSLKRDLLIKLPAVLVIHLKRYQRVGNQLQKCNKAVTFPINLDLRPYSSRLAWLKAGEGQYRLFGVIEHSGALNSGHYVAYVAENKDGDIPSEKFIPSLENPFPWPLSLHHLVYQLRRADESVLRGDSNASNLSDNSDSRNWHYFSDTNVHQVTTSEVLNAKPYLLFYERVM